MLGGTPAMKRLPVMIRFTPEEYEAIASAHEASQAATDHWNRVPFSTWIRRTLLNLHPPKREPAKTKPRSRKRAA